jgi:fructokinase
LEAHYLALGMMSYTLTLSPQRIILGGGVMASGDLYAKVRAETLRLLNGYIQTSAVLDIERYIVPPALGNRAGIKGALALADLAFQEREN